MLKAKTIILTLLNLSLLIGLTATANAQSIDLGRGELPLTVPENYNAETPTPLIVLLHGYTSSGPQQDSYMGFSKLAEKYGYLFIAPDGDKEPGGNESRFWNASPACCDFYNTDVDDSSYVLSIIDSIKADFNIDPNRIYLIGHSNGGFLSYRAAYDHSSTIAAIASLAGASHIDERSAPSHPVHILQIHGTADETIAYEGSEIQGNKYPSALDSVATWAAYNGCSTEGDERELRDLDARIEGHESSVLSFKKGCQVGGSSELWTIAEGSHVPPLSSTFSEQVVEWLYAHPKTSASYSD
jgi:polyhydroxybutyrate depolymerase|tara:strand:- start:2729 stop:3625 length:897 start_codon:yes stop_codon:yes gene_type:complete